MQLPLLSRCSGGASRLTLKVVAVRHVAFDATMADTSLGLRLAGLALLFDAGLVFADFQLKSRAGSPHFPSMVFIVLVDLLIGAVLISGKFGARVFGYLRVVFGILALGGFAWSQQKYGDFAMQLCFSIALLLLVLRKARITPGSVVAGVCLIWELVLVIQGATPA
jgi:hypothetical protein